MGKLRGFKLQELTGFGLMLLLAYYAPSILILQKVIPFELSFYVLVLMAVDLAIYAMQRGYSYRELRFRHDSLGTSLTIDIILSATVIAVLGVAHSCGFFRARAVPGWNLFRHVYVGLFCPAQEFCCRSIIFAELDRLAICPATAQVLVSAIDLGGIDLRRSPW